MVHFLRSGHKWIESAYDYIRPTSSIIMNGFKATGIVNVGAIEGQFGVRPAHVQSPSEDDPFADMEELDPFTA